MSRRDAFWSHVRKTAAEVAAWPEWKRREMVYVETTEERERGAREASARGIAAREPDGLLAHILAELDATRAELRDAKWNPLTAPIEEVDAHVRGLGMDPAALRARGAELGRELLRQRAVGPGVDVVVNGRSCTVRSVALDYGQALSWAGYEGDGTPTVTWRAAGRAGSLVPGASIVVVPGLVINVVYTGSA